MLSSKLLGYFVLEVTARLTQYSDKLRVTKVDVYKSNDMAGKLGTMECPCMIYFDQNEKKGIITCDISIQTVKQLISL